MLALLETDLRVTGEFQMYEETEKGKPKNLPNLLGSETWFTL